MDFEIARTAQMAAQTARDRAGVSRGYEALLVLSDGLTPDQREIARGVHAVTTATIPFVGGAAADNPAGPSREWHERRTVELEEILQRVTVEDFVVRNDAHNPRAVALDILGHTDWF